MISRCYNLNRKDYFRYGGQGIKVCDEWRSGIKPFVEWAINNGYADYLSIDRIDSNGDYTPENCRWATASEQNRHRSTCHLISYNGKEKPIVVWAELYGLRKDTLRRRIVDYGWDIERALLTPVIESKRRVRKHRTGRSETEILPNP